MKTLIVILLSNLLFISCNQTSDEKNIEIINKTYEKVLLISLDTNISMDNINPQDISTQKDNYYSFIVDSLGIPLFEKTASIELIGNEKKMVTLFFQSFKDTLTGTIEGSNNGTLPIFRDAVLFFSKSVDKHPSKIYWISFPNSRMVTNGQLYLQSTLAQLEPIAKIYIRHGLKTKDRKKWN